MHAVVYMLGCQYAQISNNYYLRSLLLLKKKFHAIKQIKYGRLNVQQLRKKYKEDKEVYE